MKEVQQRTLVTCNRCGHEDTWLDETPDYLKWEWGELVLGHEDKNHMQTRFDLCPACMREVKAWIRNGR